MNPRVFYVVSFSFAFLSSLRMPFLPEIQILLVLLLIMIYGGVKKTVLFIIIIILCTHHYVIPDFSIRFDAADYPSIYTRTIIGIRLIDFFAIILFFFSIPHLKKTKYMLRMGFFPFILLISSFFGFLSFTSLSFDYQMLLFIARSYLLIAIFFLQTLNLERNDIIELSKIAIFSWITKMFLSIIFVHPNPLYREILGIKGIIFFAGDEYLTLGAYTCCILILTQRSSIEYKKIFYTLLFAFILTLIAQRKSSIPYFTLIFLMLWIEYKNKPKYFKFFNLGLIINEWAAFLFILVIVLQLDSPLVRLAFLEMANLTETTMESLRNIWKTNIIESLLGITPIGKYEIRNLLPEFDHSMAFGKEVGQKFRYMIWGLPFGRVLLNIGLLGFIYLHFNLIRNAFRLRSKVFYLYFFLIPIFTYSIITPVTAIASGIGFACLYHYKHSNNNLIIEKGSDEYNT